MAILYRSVTISRKRLKLEVKFLHYGPYQYHEFYTVTVGNGNGNENISNAPPTVDRRRITYSP